jgi:hypothetical protein
MKGLEPSTFCMASVFGEDRAIQARMENDFGGGCRSRVFPFFPSLVTTCVTNEEQV